MSSRRGTIRRAARAPRLPVAVATLAALLVLGATAALAGQARSTDEPGVTATTVLLGGTTPLSGSAASFASVARGAEAYFKYVNARGGVAGRKILYTVVDDAYNPAQTVQATRQLVEQEQVFAIFNALGTEHNLAIRDYLRAAGVPQLFAASGSTQFGSQADEYPGLIGFQPSYQAEGWVYGKYLARTRPGARIAVLFQNDDYGKDLLAGLKRGLQRSKAKVIAAQPYEVTATDVQSQVAKLKASGASVFAIFATPRFAIQAYVFANRLGWKPKLTINNAVSSASNIMLLASEGGTNKVVSGSLSIVFTKDPTDPKWRKDAAVKLYRSVLKRHAPGANPDDVFHLYGMAVAWTTVELLRKVGKNLTRAALVKAMGTMSFPRNPFLLPGIGIKTGPRDHFPIEQMLLQRWDKTSWKSFGGIWGYRG